MFLHRHTVVHMIYGVLLCSGIAWLYVRSLYIWELLDKVVIKGIFKKEMYGMSDRNDDKVIACRFVSISLVTYSSWLLVEWYIGRAYRFGTPSLMNLIKTGVQVVLLMLGPCYEQFPFFWQFKRADIMIFIRNIIVAPLFEEIVFRAFFWEILTHSGCSFTFTVILAPVLFALSHMHGNSSSMSVRDSFGTVVHTCIFGWIAFYFFVTRSVWDAVLAHALCNCIGLPNRTVRKSKYYSVNPKILYVMGLTLFLLTSMPLSVWELFLRI